MKYVSGVGEYTLVFTAPENWSSYAGAFVDFEYGRDQIGAVIINGSELPASNASDRLRRQGTVPRLQAGPGLTLPERFA